MLPVQRAHQSTVRVRTVRPVIRSVQSVQAVQSVSTDLHLQAVHQAVPPVRLRSVQSVSTDLRLQAVHRAVPPVRLRSVLSAVFAVRTLRGAVLASNRPCLTRWPRPGRMLTPISHPMFKLSYIYRSYQFHVRHAEYPSLSHNK